jgi:predicted DsbA family dithiol-disulfide isomerase
MKVTYYLEVTSSWCFWFEPQWAELKRRYAGRVEFDWQIAKMQPDDFPTSNLQYDWFLLRSSTIMKSPMIANSAYYEFPIPGGYPAASSVALAARDLGFGGDDVRLALSSAAYRDGRKVGRIEVAVEIAAKVSGLDPAKLRARAESPEVAAHMEQTTREYFSHQISQRPAFVLTDGIGDKAVFAGVMSITPLTATIDTMIADTAAYADFAAQHGRPPSA